MLDPFFYWSFDGRILIRTQHSQPHLLEQLPLSLCTFPFFLFLLSEPLFFAFFFQKKKGVGSGLPIFINSRVSLNLKVFT